MKKNKIKSFKALFITNIPSPYRVEFFNLLSKEINLTVLYQKRRSSERAKEWKTRIDDTYESIFLKGINTGVDNSLSFEVIKYINNSYDAIIICGNSSPTEILAIEICKLKSIPYFVEGDGAFLSFRTTIKDKIKYHLLKNASLYLSTCKELDNYYLAYGAEKTKIKRYHFSSVSSKDILENPLTQKEKIKLRVELNLIGDKIILSTGRFIYEKGFDILIKAMKYMDSDTTLYIVGGNPTKEYLDLIKKNQLTNIYFVDFLNSNELNKYYLAADLFVLPTRSDVWGLVINEAMAKGLPTITTEKCNAGLEMVSNDSNGYIVPVEEIKGLSDVIKICLLKKEKMSFHSLNVIKMYTIEQMVLDHLQIFTDWRSQID